MKTPKIDAGPAEKRFFHVALFGTNWLGPRYMAMPPSTARMEPVV